MRKISLAVLLCHSLTAVTAQQHYSKAVNEQIARVEANLSNFRNLELGGTKTFTFDTAGTVTGYSNTINGRLRATGQKITTLDTLKPRPGQSGVLGRHLLETKNYDKAIGFLSKGMASEPSDSSLVKNLAHSFLFKGDFTKAIELYRQYLKSGDNANELIKSSKDDFEYFRNAGFDHSVIKKASETLSL